MTRDLLERHQVWFYLVAAVLGLIIGETAPGTAVIFDAALWPVLGLLLFVTFVQVPLTSIASAFTDLRFLSATLLGNFALVPLIVWGLIQFVPADDAIRLGLLLVLLAPCTDWFITFTQLGRGDAARATAITPLNIVVQLLLLPLYVWLMTDIDLSQAFTPMSIGPVALVVLVPLVVATASEIWFRKSAERERNRQRLAAGAVPLLCVVIFMVAVANGTAVRSDLAVVPLVTAVAVAFLMIAALGAKLVSVALRLPTAQGRTLAFSLTTRNSFVVLPIALALPAEWEIAAIVIVIQSLVELLTMICFIWFVPRVLFADRENDQANRR